MMLDGRYAGRFPIKISSDLQQATGLYRVQAKSAAAASGAAAKPQWIELGNTAGTAGKIGIEASSELRGNRGPSQHALAQRTGHGRRLRNPLGRFGLDYPAVTSRRKSISPPASPSCWWPIGRTALLALPLIETQASASKTPDTTLTVDPALPPRIKPWEVLFSENSWERKEAKVISSNDQVLLLWKTYANHADGWVDLNPLTIVFMTDETASIRKSAYRHAMVMEVPGGANLHFDRPLD